LFDSRPGSGLSSGLLVRRLTAAATSFPVAADGSRRKPTPRISPAAFPRRPP